MMSIEGLERVQPISAIRAVQPYTSVLYGIVPSAVSGSAGAKASSEDAKDTRAKMRVQEAAAGNAAQDSSQGKENAFTTVTHTLDDGTIVVEELQNGHVISSQHIKVAAYSASGSEDAVTRAYAKAGGFAADPGLLYDVGA